MMLNQHCLILGGIIVDQYLLMEHTPKKGEDVLINDSFFHIGGCSINVGMTLKNLGQQPHIISVVGDNDWGKKISLYLDQQGFARDTIRVAANKNSGYCISMIETKGERTFLTYKGCESEFSADMIGPELMEQISQVYITGYYLLDINYAHDIIQFITEIKNKGAQILFDPGALVDHIEDDILIAMIEHADIMTPNEIEMDKLKSKLDLQENAVSWFLQKGVKVFALKMGKQGVFVWTKDKKYEVPPFKVSSVDTSGAGDSFAGGLLYGLIQQYDMEQTIRFASACGALTTTMMGPHGVFSHEDVLDIMDKEG